MGVWHIWKHQGLVGNSKILKCWVFHEIAGEGFFSHLFFPLCILGKAPSKWKNGINFGMRVHGGLGSAGITPWLDDL